MVTIIIPAFNESDTIDELIKSVIKHPQIREVIVVNDGSTDNTGKIAEKAGARVLNLAQNVGKADAMDIGVRAAQSEIILFLDADVIGFTHEKISNIIDPVLDGKLEMHIGILPRPSLSILSKKVFYFILILSGMRALTKELWYKVPRVHKDGFKIELALNHMARKWGKGLGYEIIPGLIHTTKEKKHGISSGLWRRVKMIKEIIFISVPQWLEALRKK